MDGTHPGDDLDDGPLTNVEAANAKTCDNCGDRFDPSEWYPVVAETTDDGDLEILSFCGEQCREEWSGD